MAVQKSRKSNSCSRMRRSHDHIDPLLIISCKHCGSKVISHHLCNNCGYYKGNFIKK